MSLAEAPVVRPEHEIARAKFRDNGNLLLYRHDERGVLYVASRDAMNPWLQLERGGDRDRAVWQIWKLDLEKGYLPYYSEKAPQMSLWVVPQEGSRRFFDREGLLYLAQVMFTCMGDLVQPMYREFYVSDDDQAAYQREAFRGFGHFREEELPQQIDMKATINGMIHQIAIGSFDRPILYLPAVDTRDY